MGVIIIIFLSVIHALDIQVLHDITIWLYDITTSRLTVDDNDDFYFLLLGTCKPTTFTLYITLSYRNIYLFTYHFRVYAINPWLCKFSLNVEHLNNVLVKKNFKRNVGNNNLQCISSQIALVLISRYYLL